MSVVAVLSMLHEPQEQNSATRLFRGDPVVSWTLDRLDRCANLDNVSILCWEDQLPAVTEATVGTRAHVLAKGPRVHVPSIDSITAARKWADGWRGASGGPRFLPPRRRGATGRLGRASTRRWRRSAAAR